MQWIVGVAIEPFETISSKQFLKVAKIASSSAGGHMSGVDRKAVLGKK